MPGNKHRNGSRRYGRAWKRIRDKYISEHPLCEICSAEATEVHHIIPICEGGTADRSNLMAVCRNCHAKIHIKEREKTNEDYNEHQDERD